MSGDISNEQLYDEFKDLKGEFREPRNGINRGFEKINDKFGNVNESIDEQSNRNPAAALVAISVAAVFVIGFPAYFAHSANLRRASLLSASMKASLLKNHLKRRNGQLRNSRLGYCHT